MQLCCTRRVVNVVQDKPWILGHDSLKTGKTPRTMKLKGGFPTLPPLTQSAACLSQAFGQALCGSDEAAGSLSHRKPGKPYKLKPSSTQTLFGDCGLWGLWLWTVVVCHKTGCAGRSCYSMKCPTRNRLQSWSLSWQRMLIPAKPRCATQRTTND